MNTCFNIRSNDFICRHIAFNMCGEIPSGAGEGGVAGERRFVGERKFHSWGKSIVMLTNIQSDWMSNPSSGIS